MIYYCKECKNYFTDEEAEEVNTTYESELGLDDGRSTPERYLTCPCGSDQIEEICETIDEEELCEQLNDCGIPDLYDYIELREELKNESRIRNKI